MEILILIALAPSKGSPCPGALWVSRATLMSVSQQCSVVNKITILF